MKNKRDWKPGEWVWGYIPNTNVRVRGKVANANGLIDGYVRVWKSGTNRTQVVRVAKREDPRK